MKLYLIHGKKNDLSLIHSLPFFKMHRLLPHLLLQGIVEQLHGIVIQGYIFILVVCGTFKRVPQDNRSFAHLVHARTRTPLAHCGRVCVLSCY